MAPLFPLPEHFNLLSRRPARLAITAFIFLNIFLIFSRSICVAQTASADSLTRALGTASDLHTKADILHRLASESWDYDFDRSFSYATESYEIARRISYKKGMTLALSDIGLYYYFKGEYGNSRQYFHRALSGAENDEPRAYLASVYMRLGNLHREQARFDSASFCYNKASTYLDETHPSSSLAWLYHNKGWMEYELAHYASAQYRFKQALAIRVQLGDSMLVGESWKTLGMVASARNEFDSATYYMDKVQQLARRHHDPELLIFYNIYKGELLFRKSEFIPAVKLFTEALDSLAIHDYKRYRALALKNIGRIFDWQGDYPRGLEYYYSALKIEEELNSRQEIARTYNLMGWVYSLQADFSKAKRISDQSGKIFREIGDESGLSDFYALSGYIAYSRKRNAEALLFYDSALVIRERIGTSVPVANVLNFMADVFIAQGDYDRAADYERKVFAIAQQVNDRVGIAAYYNSISKIALAQKNYAEAEKHALLALREATSIHTVKSRRDAYQHLITIYRAKGDHAEALKYYDHYTNLGDSLYTLQSSTHQAELDALYKLEKREQEIQNLHHENILQQATLTAQHEKIKLQNTVGVFFILGIILLGSLAYVLYRYNRANTKANLELNRLNQEITAQKLSIQDQSEELRTANEALLQLNNELIEKTEEVEAQSEELRESNETIVAMNDDLDSIVTKRTAQLKEAYKELDTFFYRSSHDFRRPLTTFMGLAEVAKITVKDTIALDLFDKVKETARALDKMLIKLQSISDVGAQELVFKEVLVREIFSSVCDGFEEELGKKCIRTDCEINLHEPFISYPAMVKIIIENLVENAIQFCAMQDPLIRLTAEQEGGNIVIRMKDNGQGIKPEYHNQVFDMYFRGSDRSKGNGLGLYIVKKAVEKLHGHISLSSSYGEGSMFVVTIPMNRV